MLEEKTPRDVGRDKKVVIGTGGKNLAPRSCHRRAESADAGCSLILGAGSGTIPRLVGTLSDEVHGDDGRRGGCGCGNCRCDGRAGMHGGGERRLEIRKRGHGVQGRSYFGPRIRREGK